MRPDGRLILRFRTNGDVGRASRRVTRVPKHMIERLDSLRIALPEAREEFSRRLEVYAEERRDRESDDGNLADVERLIDAAGGGIETGVPLGDKHSAAVEP